MHTAWLQASLLTCHLGKRSVRLPLSAELHCKASWLAASAKHCGKVELKVVRANLIRNLFPVGDQHW